MKPIGLAPDAFASAFPFHIAVDRDLRLISVGGSLARLVGSAGTAGALLSDLVRIRRPTLPLEFEALRQATQRLLVVSVSTATGEVKLRGEVVHDEEHQALILLCSPWFNDPDEVQRHGLTMRDFALHCGIGEMLHVLRIQLNAMEETAALAKERESQVVALRDTSSRLETLISNLHSGVLVEDEHRRIALVNRTLCSMFGIDAPPEALVGADCRNAAEESKARFADPAAFVDGVNRALQLRVPEVGTVLELADGRVFVRDYVPIYVGRDYRGHLWQYRDVTAEKAAESTLRASEQLKTAILQTALDAIVTVDEVGVIQEWNPAAESIFGWQRNEVLGVSLDEVIIPERYRARHRAGMERMRETRMSTMTGARLRLEALRKSGEEFACELAITEVPTAGGQMFTGFLRDVSQQTWAEEQLRVAAEQAERASRAKSDFLATVSHEMRTPLNAILGMGELLADTKLDREQRDFLQTLTTSGEALLSLINDFLDVSKIESGEIQIERLGFDPKQIVDSVIRILGARANAKGIALGARLLEELPESLVGDQNRIRQVLLNLTANALKFTERGQVALHAWTRVEGEGRTMLCFSVRDTGIGIAEEHQQQIFSAFFQVDGSNTRRHGGTGLGLGICRLLAERMGGRVWLEESALGRGSEFRFEVEAPPEERSGAPAARTALDGLGERGFGMPARILLAEDNVDNQTIIERALAAAGHCFTVARDGREAVERFWPGRHDVLLFDVEMPESDGISATKTIRAMERERGLPRVPIIALTAHAVEPVRRRCLDAGMDEFLIKPASATELRAAISRHAPVTPALLVADDSPESREPLLCFIERDGRYRACWARDGTQALEMVERAQFAGVFLDLEMPVMTGFEAARAMRERGCELPIIAVSGHDDASIRERCRAEGFDEYLSKPLTRARLADVLDALSGAPVPPPSILVSVDPDIGDLVADFLAQRRRDVHRIEELVQSERFDELRVLGHNLKGAAGGYGFTDLGPVGAAIESAAQAQDRERLMALRDEFAAYLDRVVLAG